jgi:hypothetical protein
MVSYQKVDLKLMSSAFNIYCDESCHLEHDSSPVMILGAVVCPLEKILEVHKRIKEIKIKNGLSKIQEIKWTKVSPSKVGFYNDLVDYFFDDDDLRFRAIICHKSNLNHEKFNHSSHDEWYYKMYFYLLKNLIDDRNNYYVYLDIKDTRSAQKRDKLHETLCNDRLDFNRKFLKSVQHARSHEIQALQLADVLIGAVSYANRKLFQSSAKLSIIQRIQHRANLSNFEKTNYSSKFNLFHWQGREN